ncbi:MAG: D-tyrosyl-tRNA(Tyr) deacylase [Bacteroidota bacterium]|jgi:D-tyrosyl-tRNA(Tyr) deacylase
MKTPLTLTAEANFKTVQMRVVIQRVSEAAVKIDGTNVGKIQQGLLVLLGIETEDQEGDAAYLVQKISNLRIFSDAEGKMNLSIQDVGGQFLVVSQFTLHADTRKGKRPSYIRAARPEQSIPLYEYFVAELQKMSNSEVQTGRFGANMQVALVNDGPVTIIIDSKGEL